MRDGREGYEELELARAWPEPPRWRWAATVRWGGRGQLAIVAHDPGQLDEEQVEILLEALERSEGIGGAEIFDEVPGMRVVQPDELGRTVEVGRREVGGPALPRWVDRLFEPRERPCFDEAWERLPVVDRIGGLPVRWVGPLVDIGHDRWLGELAEAAWGHLDGDTRWTGLLEEAGEMLDPETRRIRPAFARAFAGAVDALAWAGTHAGPTGDPEHWAAWLAWEWAAVHERVKARAERRGAV